ncbi:MAG: hydantoinase B/oxoprolinase family protein [Chloroflexi bacterium]|nr:hydantoinase B/oxoprolinase family protein [Chloroflexota bacterium]
MSIDPVTLEILRNKFDMVCQEMQTVLVRSAQSTIIKEALDALNALFDTQGQVISQSISIPCHLGMVIPAVQRILAEFPPDQMHDGDIYTMNDPHDGGTHIPDVFVVIPVIYGGRAIGVAVCIAHQVDMGGKTYGSKAMDATEIFQEGLIIPPIKLYDQGKRNDTLFKILERNSRIPQMVLNDIQAQIAGCTIGKRRLVDLCERYGVETVLQAKDDLMAHSELMTRQVIEKMPGGTYSAVGYVDSDGVELDKPVKIQLAVTIRGSEMIVDFAGTSPQTKGPINSTYGSTVSAVYYTLRSVTDPTIPNNAGCFRPIAIRTSKGTVVDPVPPSPVNARMPTVCMVGDVMLEAMAQAIPHKVAAVSSSTCGPGFGGVDPLTGKRFMFMDFVAGGVGARPMKDGIDSRDSGAGNCHTLSAEVIEMNYPIRVNQFGLWEDSCGAGRYQGGLGTIKAYEVTRGELTLIHQTERQFQGPPGLLDGEPGSKQETIITRRSGQIEAVPSVAVRSLREGDRLVVKAPGGGGAGNPRDRDRQAVLEDIADGRVSAAFARDKYGTASG